MLDPIYAPIAAVLGVQAKDVNEAHTPTILTSIISTLSESYMNNFGALVVTTAGATSALAIGSLARDQMGFGDRKFILEMGANFLWNVMKYVANPKLQKDVFKHAGAFGQSVTSFNVEGIQKSMLQTEADVKKRFVVRDKETGKLRPATANEVKLMMLKKGASEDAAEAMAASVVEGQVGGPPPQHIRALSPDASVISTSQPYGGKPFVPRSTPWSAGGQNKLDFQEDAYQEDVEIEEALSVKRAGSASYLPTIS
jgi:hypothetical protein